MEFDIKAWDAARATAPHWCRSCQRVLSLRETVEQAGLCSDCYGGDSGAWRPSESDRRPDYSRPSTSFPGAAAGLE